jgi:hypothetical protein
MNQPETISEMLTAMDTFCKKGWVINASDVSHESKLTQLTQLSTELGLS